MRWPESERAVVFANEVVVAAEAGQGPATQRACMSTLFPMKSKAPAGKVSRNAAARNAPRGKAAGGATANFAHEYQVCGTTTVEPVHATREQIARALKLVFSR